MPCYSMVCEPLEVKEVKRAKGPREGVRETGEPCSAIIVAAGAFAYVLPCDPVLSRLPLT